MQDPGFQQLKKSVIDADLCTRCGGCVASCPVDVLKFGPYRIEIEGECVNCGTCLRICPGSGVDFSSIKKDLFGGSEKSRFGTGCAINKKRMNLVATDREEFTRGYFGGRVSAVLINGMETGLIDGALVTGWGEGRYLSVGSATIARNRREVLDHASSKYVFSPVLTLLKAVESDPALENVALVGLPCHVEAFRKMERNRIAGKYTSKVKYVIGLNCGAPNMDEESWRRAVEKLTGVPGGEVKVFRNWKIKSDLLRFHVELEGGPTKEVDIPLKRYFQVIHSLPNWPRCDMCPDYSAELSDVTFGGPTIRTERGKEIVMSALDRGKLKRGSIKRSAGQMILNTVMCRIKRRRTSKKMRERERKGLPVPDFG
jgi:coenzyme F420 hydrogenase subunit beta